MPKAVQSSFCETEVEREFMSGVRAMFFRLKRKMEMKKMNMKREEKRRV